MSEVNHILLSRQPDGRWLASIGRKGESGYVIAYHEEPLMAAASALVKVGEGDLLNSADPLRRAMNALDRNLIARWAHTGGLT